MKTTLTRLFLVASLSIAAVTAQRPGNPGRGNQGGGPPDPAAMVERRVQMLTRFLTLTEAQAAQATTIFTQAQTAGEPVRTSLREAHQAMRTAIKANDDGGIATAASSVGTLTGQEAAIQGRADGAFYAILTAEQKTKYDQMGPGRMGPGGMGRPGGMGMGPGGMQRGPRPPQQ